METSSASSQSCIGFRGGSSQFPRIEKGGGPGGDKLMFDVDANLVVDDIVG